MNDRTPPSSELPQWPDASGSPPADVRPPAIHRPYLIAAGLFCLSSGVSIHLERGGVASTLAEATVLLAWALHVAWLHCLYTDGERHLGDELPMPARRVLVFSLILCVLLPVWTAFALMVLLRSAVNALRGRLPDGPVPVRRHAQDVPGLGFAALMSLVVDMVLLARLDSLGALTPGSESLPSELVGETMSVVYTVFHLAVGGYYLWFVSRAVPALYRSYVLLAPDGPAHKQE